jgi:hypothetical protein
MRAILPVSALLLLAACTPAEAPVAVAADSLVVRISASRMQVPARVKSGWRAIRLESDSGRHNLVAFRIDDTVDPAAFIATLDSTKTTPAGAVALGGPEAVAVVSLVMLQLPPGRLLVTCLSRGADEHRHGARGEWALVFADSTAATTNAVSPLPHDSSAVVVSLRDFAYVAPTSWRSGKRTLDIRNDGRADHLILIERLRPGKTLRDWMTSDDSVRVGDPVTGLARLGPGQNALLQVELIPGRYVLSCLVGDPISGKTHAELGMLREIEVIASTEGRTA